MYILSTIILLQLYLFSGVMKIIMQNMEITHKVPKQGTFQVSVNIIVKFSLMMLAVAINQKKFIQMERLPKQKLLAASLCIVVLILRILWEHN